MLEFVLLLIFASVVWTYVDARVNGRPLWWALGVFLLWPLFLPAYLVARKQ
jgi:hypothetical protein